MTVAEVLAREECWIKGSLALDASGTETDPCDGGATCWCLMGALDAAYLSGDRDRATWLSAMRKLDAVVSGRGYVTIASFNDHKSTTFEMVQEVIREAGV